LLEDFKSTTEAYVEGHVEMVGKTFKSTWK